jgi:hypothetical protein
MPRAASAAVFAPLTAHDRRGAPGDLEALALAAEELRRIERIPDHL